jgi:hypothetical protein
MHIVQENKMPGQDRTGPMGQGRLTGRGLGPCGQGVRQGFGRGCGFRRRSFGQSQVVTEVQEKELLKQELELMESEKDEIEKRLKELK